MSELNKNALVDMPGDFCPVCGSRKVTDHKDGTSGDRKVSYKCGAVYGHDGDGTSDKKGTGLWWLAKTCPHGVDKSLNAPSAQPAPEPPATPEPEREIYVEEYLSSALDRLEKLDKEEPCEENGHARENIEEALGWLKQRSERKAAEKAAAEAPANDNPEGGPVPAGEGDNPAASEPTAPAENDQGTRTEE